MEHINTYKNKALSTSSKKVITACCEIIKKHTGLYPYDEQIQAAKYLYKGDIVDMKTGEGKTIACLLAMLMAARDGRKVYLATSNDYLSERDYEYSRPILEELGIKSVFLKASIGGEEETYKAANVIYATGETLIFDYLRGIKADYDFAIVDEIDYVLVECANHDFSVADEHDDNKIEMPENIYRRCLSISNVLSYSIKKETTKKIDYLFDMQHEADVIVDHPKHIIEITTRGYEKLEKILGNNAKDTVFLETMQATLLAKFFYIRDVHYIVEGDNIVVINESNGRKSIGGSNDISIQTAIEIKENVQVTTKSLLHNTCSFPVFFSLFKTLTGVSGTAALVPYDFSVIFNKNVRKVKEHFPNKRKEIFEYIKTDDERITRIEEIISKGKGPFLVVSASDKRSKFLIDRFQKTMSEKTLLLLDNHTLSQEKEILENIKTQNAVLFSSKIVGRGTDISLPDSFEDGLIVILTERFFSERAERQIIGRTGRNGKPGKCYVLTSRTDKLFLLEHKEKQWKREKYIKGLQKKYEGNMFEGRKHIYARSKLFFDQDAAIKDVLEKFASYEEILKFAQSQVPANQDHVLTKKRAELLLRKMINNDIPLLSVHKEIFACEYARLRPYYQQQFLQYNDVMADTLYNNDGFYYRCKEYIGFGKNILLEAIVSSLLKILA